MGRYPISLAVGDFNGDGIADLVIVNENVDNTFTAIGNSSLTVLLGVAPAPKFAAQPLNGAAGTAIPAVSVQVLDQNGNLVKASESVRLTTGLDTTCCSSAQPI